MEFINFQHLTQSNKGAVTNPKISLFSNKFELRKNVILPKTNCLQQ
jgi:hypothetical protein